MPCSQTRTRDGGLRPATQDLDGERSAQQHDDGEGEDGEGEALLTSADRSRRSDDARMSSGCARHHHCAMMPRTIRRHPSVVEVRRMKLATREASGSKQHGSEDRTHRPLSASPRSASSRPRPRRKSPSVSSAATTPSSGRPRSPRPGISMPRTASSRRSSSCPPRPACCSSSRPARSISPASAGLVDPVRLVARKAGVAIARVSLHVSPYVLIGKPQFASIGDLKGKNVAIGSRNDMTFVLIVNMLAAVQAEAGRCRHAVLGLDGLALCRAQDRRV